MKEYLPDGVTLDDALEKAKDSLRKYRYRENDKIKELQEMVQHLIK